MVRTTNDDVSNGPDGRSVLRWVVAGVLALVALIGAMSIIAVFVWAAGDLPGWLTIVLGGGVAVGTAAFAWIIASALRSNDRSGSV